MHGHMAFLIDFIILELASICSDFLMRYVCAKASANPVRSNNTNLASIRTILSAFTSVGRYLQSKLLNNALNFLFVYGISLIAKLSENPTISVILMFFTNPKYLFLNFLIRIFSIKTLLPIHICGFGHSGI